MTPTTWRGKTFRDLVNEAKERVQEIDHNEVADWVTQNTDKHGNKFCILDVREPDDYVKGHIPTATNVPRGLLELEIDEVVPDQDQTIVLYCGGGSRSALAADTLHQMGYANVYSLAGGFRQWKEHHETEMRPL